VSPGVQEVEVVPSPFKELACCEADYRITESQNGRGWKGPL